MLGPYMYKLNAIDSENVEPEQLDMEWRRD